VNSPDDIRQDDALTFIKGMANLSGIAAEVALSSAPYSYSKE